VAPWAHADVLSGNYLQGYQVAVREAFPNGVTRAPVDERGGHGVCRVLTETSLYTPSEQDEDPAGGTPPHFVGYRLRCPRERRVSGKYSDQLWPSGIGIELGRVRSVLVPSGGRPASDSGPAAPPPGTNHYLCYRAKGQRSRLRSVVTSDEFGMRRLHAGRVHSVCNPADVDGSDPGAASDPDHYVCYRATEQSGPRSLPRVLTNNGSFGENTLEPRALSEVCLPALRSPQ
jgi:hypothetical protein